MEELLQLHVVIPEENPDDLDAESTGNFDDVHDLLIDVFPVPNEDVPSFDRLGMTVSSSLFERRPDNLEHVDEIESQLNEWYPNATVFKSSYEETFGEHRSAADPDRHIMLLVTNWGVQQPTVRWSLRKKTLQAPPLVLGDQIFHSNADEIFAVDGTSGNVQWEHEGLPLIQVPVGNERLVIGYTGHDLVAVDRANGELRWRSEFDPSDDEIIDSRVAIGDENAYVGLRTGAVVGISLETGDRTVVGECDDSVVDLQMIASGLVAQTVDGNTWFIDFSGRTAWPQGSDLNPLIRSSHDGTLYATAGGMLLALAEEDGSVKWQIDFPTVNGIDQSGDTLVATTSAGLVAIDAENGDRIWDSNESGQFTTLSNPVIVDGVVAYIGSNNVIDQELYSGARNILHIVDLSDGAELQRFELGVGDSYGLSKIGDAVVCSAGEELIYVENFPNPA